MISTPLYKRLAAETHLAGRECFQVTENGRVLKMRRRNSNTGHVEEGNILNLNKQK